MSASLSPLAIRMALRKVWAIGLTGGRGDAVGVGGESFLEREVGVDVLVDVLCAKVWGRRGMMRGVGVERSIFVFGDDGEGEIV